jgi:serine/threonine protein kinase
MINEKLNGFTIKSLISEEGGMAKVYLAENAIGKRAAVKVLRPKFFWDEPVKQRFINEAKTMVKLEHEHICSVYDLVVTDNYAAILLEFMEGDDLSVLLEKNGSLSEEEVIKYLPQICSALAFAHQKNVVHRDIKPSNLFLHNGKIKLMDFGIAKVKSEAGGRLTQTGTRMGSISYMSPEQIRSTKDVDLRTDIYSLGISLYQMLTGSLPYSLGKNDTEFAIMERIVRENPKPITGISNEMNDLIQKATAKEPKDRFASTEEILQQISAHPSHFQIIKTQNTKKPKKNTKPKTEETIFETPQKLSNFTDTVKKIDFEMVAVKGGSFQMGSDKYKSEQPIHEVTLSDFYIGKYPVTQKLWEAVMGDNPSYFQTGRELRAGDIFRSAVVLNQDTSDNPVENVSWDDVQKFINKLNKKSGKKHRLPTEAEWEYAAKGGNKSQGFEYAGSNSINDVVWYNENSYSLGKNHPDYGTNPVGEKKANELGIFDMSGNVSEWCSDWYASYPSGTQTNPKGALSGGNRVLRGGSWYDDAQYCRSAYRISGSPVISFNFLGFRLVFAPQFTP